MSIDSFLHDKGYTFFNINGLTYKEIQQLLDGENIRAERAKQKG